MRDSRVKDNLGKESSLGERENEVLSLVTSPVMKEVIKSSFTKEKMGKVSI